MDLQEAKDLLDKCQRYELRDHAFGDTEIEWINKEIDPDEVGWGYFGAQGAHVAVRSNGRCTDFIRDDAQALRSCGTAHIHRNDETGPDEYQEGVTMPGLTLEGVWQELTNPPE